MHKFIFNYLIKDPIGFIPMSFLLFQIIHKINLQHQRVYFLKEFPVSLQILWFSINVSYVIKNSPSVFPSFYLYIVFFSQFFFAIISSMISRELYKDIIKNIYVKYGLFILFYLILPILGLYLLVYSMGFRLQG
ncbi:MAG TPA: hypothetical protein DCE80_19995 [Ignavibacteriales bacterium]|nr:hypothetical protein [Ignavibacteriales bacterium]